MKSTIDLAKEAGLCLARDEYPLIETFRALIEAEEHKRLLGVDVEPVMEVAVEDGCWITTNSVFTGNLPDGDHLLYTKDQLAATALKAEQRGREEERRKHCACQWDADDNRTHTCVRHQGWLDVIEEWSGRAKDAEKRIAELEEENAQLREQNDAVDKACAELEQQLKDVQKVDTLAQERSKREVKNGTR